MMRVQKIQLQSASGRRLRLRTFSAVVGVKGLLDSKGKKISPFQTDYAALEWLGSVWGVFGECLGSVWECLGVFEECLDASGNAA